MNRRHAISCLASVALAATALAPALVLAQAALVRRRVALAGFAEMFESGLEAVAKTLARRGFAEGRQIEVARIVVPPAPSTESRRGLDYLVPTLDRIVTPHKPEVIVVLGSILTKGMHLATRSIPIVAYVADPVALGVASSLARPGANVTGVAAGIAETSLKSVETLKELVPRLERLAIFHDSRPVATNFAGHFERAARSLGVEPVMVSTFETTEMVKTLRALPPRRVQAAVLAWSPPEGGEAFIGEAASLRLPLMGVSEEDVERGCLVAYNSAEADLPGRLAEVVEQILRGADPATTPFRFPQVFRLILNRRAARALGFTIPPGLLVRADRVIE